MKKSMAFLSIGFCALTLGCSTPQPLTSVPHSQSEHLVASTLWQQHSAEYRALAYQAYSLAKLRLDEILKSPKSKKKRAIIFDIDETLLDGSPYESTLILESKSYPYKWDEFIASASGKPIPGALEFAKYADKKEVSIFYVTNRKEKNRTGTLTNLKKVGFPNVSEKTLVMRTKDRSKEPRRNQIEKDYEVVLLVGDNLSDFDKVYDDKNLKNRKQAVDSTKQLFGKKYIILPNPMYGDWEGAVYDYRWTLSEDEKFKVRHDTLEAFE